MIIIGVVVCLVAIISSLMIRADLKCGCEYLHVFLCYIMFALAVVLLCVGVLMVCTNSVIKSLNTQLDTQWPKMHDAFKAENPTLYATLPGCGHETNATAWSNIGNAASCRAAIVGEMRSNGKFMAVLSIMMLGGMVVNIYLTSQLAKKERMKDKKQEGLAYGGYGATTGA